MFARSASKVRLFLKKIPVNKKGIPVITLLILGLVYFTMALANHYLFRSFAFDYGSYNFGFWDYSHFRISQNPLVAGTFLQDHYSFTFMFFIPIYWLLNWLTGTYTLIIIQSALIVAAAWYTCKLVVLKSDNYWLGTASIVYYFVILGRYTSLTADCNLAIIASCFVPVFLYYFEVKKYITAFVILILSLLSRENMPLWFIFIFIVLMILHRKEKKIIQLSLAGIMISAVYFILLFKVLIPAIETPDRAYNLFNYGALGAGPGEAFWFILKHPIETIKIFFTNHLHDPANNGIKGEFFWTYLVSGGFVLIFKPKYFIWFLPLLAQKLLNDSSIRWGINTYYSIEIVTLLPLTVYLIIAGIKPKATKYGLSILVCVVTLAVSIYKLLNPKNCVLPWAMHPVKGQIYNENFFKSDYKVKRTNEILDLIPHDAKVSAANFLIPHLAQRQYIYFFPIVRDADYIAMSVIEKFFPTPFRASEFEAIKDNYLNDPEWQVIAQEYPVILFKKVANDSINRDSYRRTMNFTCDLDTLANDPNYFLGSNKATLTGGKGRSDEKSLSGRFSLKLNEAIPYGLGYHFINLHASDSVQASVWRYSGSKNGHLVASCGKAFYAGNNVSGEISSGGWEKLTLKFRIPENISLEDFNIYVWNSGAEAIYFDDFTVTVTSYGSGSK